MGSGSGNTIEYILKGNATDAVIHRANCPVLIVPPKVHLDQLDRIVFATNFEKEDIKAIRYLANLAKSFNFRLEVVHVTLGTERGQAVTDKETGFRKLLSELNANIAFLEIDGKEVVNGLTHFCKQTGADLLAITHHHYSFLERIFHDSTAKKILDRQKVPLMIFPLKKKE